MKSLFPVFMIFFVTSSCATFRPDRVCDLNENTGLPILKPAAFQKHINTSQHVVIDSAKGKFDFISQLEVSPSRLVLVAMSAVGQKLFQVVYQRGEIKFQSWGVPLDFDIGYLLTDLGFIYGADKVLESCLKEVSPELSYKVNKEARIRQITGPDFNGEVVYSEDNRWSGNIRYWNSKLKYNINIEILDSTSL